MERTVSGEGSFQDVVSRVRGAGATNIDYNDFLKSLSSILAGKFPSLHATDISAIASDTLVGFLGLKERGAAERLEKPAAYVVTMALNRARDHFRARQSLETSELSIEPATLAELIAVDEGTDVGTSLSSAATIRLVQDSLALAKDKGDSTAFRVAVCFLDNADLDGKTPTNRSVARQLGMSHTGVADALQRFRGYVEAASGRRG